MQRNSTSQISKQELRSRALEFGFSDLAFVDIEPLLEAEERFIDWRAKGYAGTMSYLLRTNPINARPENLLAGAKTLLVFTANYFSECPPRPGADYGRVASYAVGKDYHKVLKKKIKEFIAANEDLQSIFANSRFFTDAVPLLEKAFAEKAGLGFQGKNTLLISKQSGSFSFIAEIISDLEFHDDLNSEFLDTDIEIETQSKSLGCAECTRCIDVCPTNALDDIYSIDSRKCISYWTIEKRGEIPQALHEGIGEWLFGCDLCQEVCPYNRKGSSSLAREAKPPFPEFQPESGASHWLYLPMLLAMHENTFMDYYEEAFQQDASLLRFARKQLVKFELETKVLEKSSDEYLQSFNEFLDKIFFFKFGETALSRSKRAGLIRNASIVARNSAASKSLELVDLINS
ncbi:MAG: tRNA epoxyqueuosine(34) reductase QueG [Candidatus Caenarcaniphilales bacterium]|nr:tRNA epoxyqueuosine(34) reductase QueG [Candidatus Caenarcaniphilales bacterium]